MTEPQIKALIHCLEVTIHAQMHTPEIAHAEKVEMLDAISDLKREFGIIEKEGGEPA